LIIKFNGTKKQIKWIIKIPLVTAKCIRVIGHVLNVELKSLNYHFNLMGQDRFSAVIVTGKKDKIVQDDSSLKNYSIT
jgi:hypothetical protein